MRSVSAMFLTSVIALGACGGYSSAPATQVATRITIYTGDGQAGPKGSVLPDLLCTNVFDASGRLMYGVMVTYTVATGGGQLQLPTSVATDKSGYSYLGDVDPRPRSRNSNCNGFYRRGCCVSDVHRYRSIAVKRAGEIE